MRQALLLARQAEAAGEVPVGAIVTANSEILGRAVTVPAGYKTDLASVPRLLRWVVPVANAKNRKAAVVHDYLCTHGDGVCRNQKQADKVFREAMGVLGLGRFRSGALYYPVRMFQSIKGWFS